MKNIKILLCLLSCFLLIGCSSSKNELVKYLESEGYDCIKNVCGYESEETANVKVSKIYDIDSKLYKVSTVFTSLQSSLLEYNWDTNKVTYEYKIIDETFNTTYDTETKEFNCESNSEDKAYKKAECSNLKEDIEKELNNFNKSIEDSGYKIK